MAEPDYDQGLKRVKEFIARIDRDLLAEFSILEIRLREELWEESIFGPATSKRNFYRILYDLSRFTGEHIGEDDFLSFCYTSPKASSQVQVTSLLPAKESDDLTWTGGTEISVRDVTYLLHDPIVSTWSNDHNALRYQAQAQQLQSTRKVWLKQVKILLPTPISLHFKSSLEKEMHLLEELTKERNRDFPLLLNQHTTERYLTIAYEAIAGHSLAEVFGPPIKPLEPQLLHSLVQNIVYVCNQLEVLHDKKLSHRNLTPETLLLMNNDRTALQDIGLAAQPFESGEGSPFYRAPEQARTIVDVPGPHTDIYQLGAILYHMLTGHTIPSPDQVISPSKLNSAIPQELDQVLLRAVNPTVRKRWLSIGDFAHALEKFI